MMRALLITLAVYAIPVFTTGIMWYLQLALSSLLYIGLIYHYSKVRERSILIGIEFINLSCITTAFFCDYILHAENFVTLYIADIINACFFTELLVVIGGLMIGVRQRYTGVGNNSSFSDKLRRWFDLSTEVNV